MHILVSLLLVGTKVSNFKVHDLAGINFSDIDFIISSSDTYQVLSGFPTVFSNVDEPSQKADLQISILAVLMLQ